MEGYEKAMLDTSKAKLSKERVLKCYAIIPKKIDAEDKRENLENNEYNRNL